jgi:hypothetical protein
MHSTFSGLNNLSAVAAAARAAAAAAGDHGKRIAVIENEFGEIDIDSELVARTETLEGSTDSITMLSNGCLCCTVRWVVLGFWHACCTVQQAL